MAGLGKSEKSGLFEVYVSGIPVDMTDGQMTRMFGQVGEVKKWYQIPERYRNTSHSGSVGLVNGFIGYKKEAEAQLAISKLNGLEIRPGQCLNVRPLNKQKKTTDGYSTDTEIVRRQQIRQHGAAAQQNHHTAHLGSVTAAAMEQSTPPRPPAGTSLKQLVMPTPAVMSGGLCATCGEIGLMQCVQCKMVRYCGRDCQAVDWKRHQDTCLTRAAESGVKPVTDGMGVIAPQMAMNKTSPPQPKPVTGTAGLPTSSVAQEPPTVMVQQKVTATTKKAQNEAPNSKNLAGSANKARSKSSRNKKHTKSEVGRAIQARRTNSAENSSSGDSQDKGQDRKPQGETDPSLRGQDPPRPENAATPPSTNITNTLVIKNIGAELQKGSVVPIQVVDVISPSQFWSRLDGYEDHLNAQQLEIQRFYGGQQAKRVDMPHKGPLVAALFSEDKNWYRARMLKQKNDQFQICYIDYGNVDVVDEVFFLEEQFYKLPIMCLSCGLGGISSASKRPWSAEANIMFCKLLGNGFCQARIMENTHDITVMQVLTSSGESIGQKLVDAKHAIFTNLGDGIGVKPTNVESSKPTQLPATVQPTINAQARAIQAQATPTPQALSAGANEVVMVSSLRQNLLEPGTKEAVMITDAGSPLLFTIQAAHRDSAAITKLQAAITTQQATYAGEYVPKRVGELVLGEYLNDWYRGEVLDIDNLNAMKVLFIDYGNCDDLTPKQMAAVPSGCGLDDYPVLGLRCALHGVSGIAQDQVWDQDLLKPFATLFNLVVKKVSNDTLFVELFMESPAEGVVSVNEQLVANGILLPLIRRVMYKDLPTLVLPIDTKIDCVVVEAPAPASIRLQIMTGAARTAFESISKVLIEDKSKFVSGYSAVKHEVVCGFYDNVWNRAEVIDIQGDQFSVRYIDWGNMEDVTSKNLAPLATGLEKFEPVSVECALAGVQSEGWSPECLRMLDMKCSVKLVRNKEGGYDGQLFDSQDNLINSQLNHSAKVITLADLPPSISLPLNIPVETCLVIHIESPAEFYVIREIAQYKAITTNLQELDRSTLHSLTPTAAGQLVCACIAGDLYRMRVKSIDGDGTTVTLISLEYGFIEANFPITELNVLPSVLLTFPALGVQCCLAQVAGDNQGFDQAVTENFTRLVLNQEVQVTLIEVRGEKCVCRMCDLESGIDIGSIVIPQTPDPALITREVPTIDALPKQSIMPENFSGVVTHIINPSDFYVQSCVDVNELTEIAVKTRAACDGLPPNEGFVPQKGELCFGLNPGDCGWYRCMLIEKTAVGFNMKFIDYGDSATVKNAHILPLSRDLLDHAPKAYACQLAGVLSATGGSWSDAATARFEKLASENVCKFKKTQSSASSYLVDMRHEVLGDIAELLVTEGHAVCRHASKLMNSPTIDGYISSKEVENLKLKREYDDMKRKMAALEAQLGAST